MPKLYVRDGVQKTVIEGRTPLDACVKCLKYGRFDSAMVGGYYWVSEQGFGPHINTDVRVPSDDVNEAYLAEKNRGLFVDCDGPLTPSVAAKIEAFIKLG